MEKELVILTKSKKYKGYCVTGVDAHNGEWIRLVQPGFNSVSPNDFKYSDGTEPNLLDTIKIYSLGECKTTLQPENVYFNINSIQPGESNIGNIIKQKIDQDYNSHSFVFHNKYPKLLEERLPSAAVENPYSLIIIEPEETILNYAFGKLYANFKWKGTQYEKFRVTDLDFNKKLSDSSSNQTIELGNSVYLVISLGEAFLNPQTSSNEYYKLVSGIIYKDDILKKNVTEDDLLKNKLIDARTILNTIACGINPYTNEQIKNDSIFNQPDTIRSLYLAVQAIDSYVENIGNANHKKRSKKKPFDISSQQLECIELSQDPIPITKFVSLVNAYKNSETKNLSYKTVLQWLIDNDYITEQRNNNNIVRYPTEKGDSLGIMVEDRVRQDGMVYSVTLYSLQAQKHILDNISDIINISSSNS